MVDIRLVVNLEAESSFRGLTEAEKAEFPNYRPNDLRFHYAIRDNSRLAGTYVEIENTGTILSVDANLRTLETREFSDLWTTPAEPTRARVQVELPRTGQPIILLAVAGGDQEFDQWADEPGTVCVGQGARCEVPEPPAEATVSLYAKAVFKKKPGGDPRMGAFGASKTRKGLIMEPPRDR